MKTFKQLVNEVAEPKGGDEKRFKDKHMVAKSDHPAAEDDQFVAKTNKKKRLADLDKGQDEEVYEEAQPRWSVSFKTPHPAQVVSGRNTAEAIRKAEARAKGKGPGVPMYKEIKKLKEEVELDEAFKMGSMKLKDGKTVKLSKEEAEAVNSLFKELNSSNKKRMQEEMMKNKSGFDKVLKFAKEAL